MGNGSVIFGGRGIHISGFLTKKTKHEKQILTRSFFDCNFLSLMVTLPEYLNLFEVCWVLNVHN